MGRYLTFLNKLHNNRIINYINNKHGGRSNFGEPYLVNGWIAEIGVRYKTATEREFIINEIEEILVNMSENNG